MRHLGDTGGGGAIFLSPICHVSFLFFFYSALDAKPLFFLTDKRRVG
jgi:hypothetical protein